MRALHAFAGRRRQDGAVLLRSKREAVDLALRKLVGEPMSREEALAMEGTGWGGNLEEMRAPDEIAHS
jgi:Arc/MetJ family transcription regulator